MRTMARRRRVAVALTINGRRDAAQWNPMEAPRIFRSNLGARADLVVAYNYYSLAAVAKAAKYYCEYSSLTVALAARTQAAVVS